MSTPPVLSQLQTFLGVTNRRQTVIASNMANVDTPGYRTQDVNFDQEMKRALTSSNIATSDTAAANQTHSVSGLLERPDGNNVDIDRESLLLSETQLQYQLGTQLLKQRFHQLLTAINSNQ